MTHLENLSKNGFIHLPNFYDKKLIEDAKNEIILREKEHYKTLNSVMKTKGSIEDQK